MKRITIGAAALVLVLVSGSVSAQDSPTSLQRERSATRTGIGVAMLGGGAALAVRELASVCATTAVASAVLSTPTCADRYVRVGAFSGVAVAGALLATKWSHVRISTNGRGVRGSITW